MSGFDAAVFAAGAVIVVLTGASLVRTLVVPRGGENLLARGVINSVRWGFLWLSRRLRTYEAKDRWLASNAPVALLLLLFAWLLLFLLGFALMLWALVGGTFFEALRESGSSLFTLGFASRPVPRATYVDFACAAGLLTVALLIAYLPVLYAAFTRRERLITMLQSRAGAPAWGPELLARHASVRILDNLPALYTDWERWSADLAESHANYPILLGFRSPHPLRSWIVGLIAVLDAAALHLALQGDRAPSQARLCLRMGFTALRDIADVLRWEYDPDPDPDTPIELSFEDFAVGVARVEKADFPMLRTVDEAYAHFRGWRVNYEAIAYRLADEIVAPPAPWTGARRHLRGVTITPITPIDRRPGGEVNRLAPPPPG